MSFRYFLAALAVIAAPVAAQAPHSALDDLIKAEQQLSDKAAALPPAAGIASMLADDGRLFTKQGMIKGREAAAADLAANPINKGTRVHWRSLRGGVSADGQQGFTLGYLDVDGADPKTAHRRYLAYWVRTASGWRVATLKQVIRPEGEADAPAQSPALPLRAAAPEHARTAAFRPSLMATEKAFSDRAQVVGLRQAFRENGREDAIHTWGEKGFSIGLKAIDANFVEETGPAKINWSADDAIVASSGDLGVTIGNIRPNDGKPGGGAFFTIWMRDDPSQPWRYVAE